MFAVIRGKAVLLLVHEGLVIRVTSHFLLARVQIPLLRVGDIGVGADEVRRADLFRFVDNLHFHRGE